MPAKFLQWNHDGGFTMSELGRMLRLLVNGDKEFKITKVLTLGAPAQFTSQLTGGHTRKHLFAYNNSDSASGEILWGGSDCDVSGMPIPKGAVWPIPVADSEASDAVSEGIDLYFCNTISGEIGDLRVLEIA